MKLLRRLIVLSLAASMERAMPLQFRRGANTVNGAFIRAIASGLAPYVLVYTVALVALVIALIFK